MKENWFYFSKNQFLELGFLWNFSNIFFFSDNQLSELISNVNEVENSHKNNSLLVIPSVSYTDSGYYECIASNGIPPLIKTNFSITIRGKY